MLSRKSPIPSPHPASQPTHCHCLALSFPCTGADDLRKTKGLYFHWWPTRPSFATYSVAAMGPSLCIIWLVFFFNYIYFNLHFKCCILSQFPTHPETPYHILCPPASMRVFLHLCTLSHLTVWWLTSLYLCILIIQHHIGDPAAYREKMSRF